MDLEFYKKLHAFVAKPLQELDRVIGDQQTKRHANTFEVQYKYLYFNHMNLAQKSSFMDLPKKAGVPVVSTISPEYIQYGCPGLGLGDPPPPPPPRCHRCIDP